MSVMVAFLIGTLIAGQTFYNFTMDNLRHFGALKAMGASNRTLLSMILLQAGLVGVIGFGIGTGLACLMGLAIAGQHDDFHAALVCAGDHGLGRGGNLGFLGPAQSAQGRQAGAGHCFSRMKMQTTTSTAMECRGIQKVFGSGNSEVHALRGIDLEVGEGELMMLVGPSGCGKTTLISVIAGVLDAIAGRVPGVWRIHAEDDQRRSARAIAAATSALSFSSST